VVVVRLGSVVSVCDEIGALTGPFFFGILFVKGRCFMDTSSEVSSRLIEASPSIPSDRKVVIMYVQNGIVVVRVYDVGRHLVLNDMDDRFIFRVFSAAFAFVRGFLK